MAFRLSNLKIRDQILLLTVPPLFALLTAVGLLFYGYWLVAQTTNSVEKAQESVVRTETLLRHATEMRMGIRNYLLTGQPSSFLTDYHLSARSVADDLAALRALESPYPSKIAALEAIQAEIARWKQQWVAPLLEGGAESKARAKMAGEKEENRQFRMVRDSLLQLLRQEQKATEGRIAGAERMMHGALALGVLVSLLFGGMLFVLARIVGRMIEHPVQQLIDASERVTRGDFHSRLPLEVQNEFGTLAGSFLHMTQALRHEGEELSALKRFSEAVTQCTSENEVYDHILHSLQERFHPSQVIIFRLRPEEDLLEAVATLVPLPKELRDWPVMEGKHSCKAVRMGRPFRVNDVTLEPLCPGKFALPGEGSYYCGPLIAGGIIIGAVRLEGARDFWTPERESLLESYLSGAASVLSNLRLLQTMREQANIDPLTGLYNRRFCEDYARKLMAMARRKDTPLGFIMMDLDHFKSFNDIYGHEVGDRILRHFAKTVTQAMRETNLTARIGGEEFVVLLPDTGPKACQMVAERIRKAVAHMTVPSGTDKPLPQITVSLGVAVYPSHGTSLEEVLQASDRALYESKRGGRNRTTLYVEETETAG
ncbi:MAG: diguanylate cyclase [Acidobacteria bacterium]|nr:diguanylate cyclase [Acidobacteriota bacterium]